MKVAFKFTSKLPELARERGYNAQDIAYLGGISLNTAKAWLYGRVIAQINSDVVAKLMRLFDLDDWHGLFEVGLYDSLSSEPFDPKDKEPIIER